VEAELYNDEKTLIPVKNQAASFEMVFKFDLGETDPDSVTCGYSKIGQDQWHETDLIES
jgi:hypothetical protein